LCNGGVLSLSPGPQYLQYRWQDNSSNPVFTAWGPGTYWVEVLDSCGNASSDTMIVSLDNSLQVSLGNDTVICQGSSIVLDAGSGWASYLWSDNSTNAQLVVTQPGSYAVEVLTASGCVARDTILIDLCISLVGGQSAGVKVYPSPSSGLMVLEFEQGNVEMLRIQLLDQLGRLVLERDLGQVAEGKLRLDWSELPAAAYYLRLEVDGKPYVGKWIKL
jgi:hypothetical protein